MVCDGNTHLPAVAGEKPVAQPTAPDIQRKLLNLARDIRTPLTYVGYSAFILMGLCTKSRPCVWEGGSIIDLINTFAPWANSDCGMQLATQGICCALEARPTGHAELYPISETRPLHRCRHYVSCANIDGLPTVVADGSGTAVADGTATEFERLYQGLGVVPMGTVIDGDCGLDVMTTMLGRPDTYQSRCDLRAHDLVTTSSVSFLL